MSRIAFVLSVIVLSAGCVGNHPYRIHYNGTTAEVDPVKEEKLKTKEFDALQTGAGIPEREWPYKLGFVEFDDRGEMFDRRQVDNAVKAIETAKDEARTNGTNAVVMVFVHGWKNNASETSGNVWGVRQMLAGLALQYKVPGGPQAPVVGIYIGWRGAVLSPPIIKEFTVLDRRDKSQNLPSAHMVEALLRIMRAAKGPDFEDASTVSVLIGHSFGGAVLETALTQTLEGLVVKAGPGGTVHWPANLIMFLNEAQEATRSYQLIESLMTNLEPRQPLDAPGIISISSTGDYATRAFFPAVQSVTRPFNSLRRYPGPNKLGIKSQTPMYFNTTAHLKQFRSHLFGRDDDPAIKAALQCCQPFMEATIAGVKYVIVEKPGALNRTPYWVMQLPPSLVPDHSTIFTPQFRSVLVNFLLGSSLNPLNTPTYRKMNVEKVVR